MTLSTVLSDPKVVAALIAAGGTVVLALLKALGWLISGPRERRRAMYVEALEHPLDWKEMPHRLRRREPDDAEEEKALRKRFHDLQENIERARGRIGTESGFLARSYCRLLRDIKAQTQPYIERARETPTGGPLGATAQDDRPPNTDDAQRRFLFDVRLHLSLWPLVPRLLLVLRNLKQPDSPKQQTTTSPAKKKSCSAPAWPVGVVDRTDKAETPTESA
jgi:hypothetical protein